MHKMGSLGWLGPLKVTGNVTIRQSAYDFLFGFNKNDVTLSRYSELFVEIRRLYLPHLNIVPVGGDPFDFFKIFGNRKLESLGYRVAFLPHITPTFRRFSKTPTCVIQTETDTDP